MPQANAELNAFIDLVFSKEGRWYCWPTKENGYSGKDLKSALYKDVYDCSGLITSSLYHVTKGRIDWRAMGSCRNLIAPAKGLPLLRPVADHEDPLVGDLAFYGHGRNMPSHVMMFCGDGRVFGACGGNTDVVSPEIAKKKGARVRFRESPLYRPDFLGFWRNPLR